MNYLFDGFVKLFVIIGIGSNEYTTLTDILYKFACIGYAYLLFLEYARANKDQIISKYFTYESNFENYIYTCLCVEVLHLWCTRSGGYKEKIGQFLLGFGFFGYNGLHLSWLNSLFENIVYPSIKISYNLVITSKDSDQVLNTNVKKMGTGILVLLNAWIIHFVTTNPHKNNPTYIFNEVTTSK